MKFGFEIKREWKMKTTESKPQNKILNLFLAAACFSTPHDGNISMDKNKKNILGSALVKCAEHTGYYRDGYCASGPEDLGVHVVCSQVTKEFLEFSKSHGNDLITPMPEYKFKGLKPGDRWCLCANRWQEAYQNKVAPPVILEATHEKALQNIKLQDIQKSCVQE